MKDDPGCPFPTNMRRFQTFICDCRRYWLFDSTEDEPPRWIRVRTSHLMPFGRHDPVPEAWEAEDEEAWIEVLREEADRQRHLGEAE